MPAGNVFAKSGGWYLHYNPGRLLLPPGQSFPHAMPGGNLFVKSGGRHLHPNPGRLLLLGGSKQVLPLPAWVICACPWDALLPQSPSRNFCLDCWRNHFYALPSRPIHDNDGRDERRYLHPGAGGNLCK